MSSIATGDIWVSEKWITRVHQIMPSRPTGCLRHGNVQSVADWPIKHVPEQSQPIRKRLQEHFHDMAKTSFMQSSQQEKHDYKPESLFFKANNET